MRGGRPNPAPPRAKYVTMRRATLVPEERVEQDRLFSLAGRTLLAWRRAILMRRLACQPEPE